MERDQPADGVIEDISQAIELLRRGEFTNFAAHVEPTFPGHSLYRYPFGVWFRGHSIWHRQIVPPILRSADRVGQPISFDEPSMFAHFLLLQPGLHQIYRTTFDWLCLMQHYGLPTRLLDWSENMLVALFFAAKRDEVDGGLMVLNAPRLNSVTGLTDRAGRRVNFGIGTPVDLDVAARAEFAVSRSVSGWKRRMRALKLVDLWGPDLIDELIEDVERGDPATCRKLGQPFAVFPNRLNERMIQQNSVFTVWGGKDSRPVPIGEEPLPPWRLIEEANLSAESPERFLLSFRVPKDTKKQIREDLRRIGIHGATMFPEIDRQAAFLQEQWRDESSWWWRDAES